MPVLDFGWKSYEVPADAGDPLRVEDSPSLLAAAEATVTRSGSQTRDEN